AQTARISRGHCAFEERDQVGGRLIAPCTHKQPTRERRSVALPAQISGVARGAVRLIGITSRGSLSRCKRSSLLLCAPVLPDQNHGGHGQRGRGCKMFFPLEH